MNKSEIFFEPKNIKLTNKQKTIILALAQGKTLKLTAQELSLKYDNFTKQTQNLYKKFNVHNRKELILKAIQQGIISSKNVSKSFKKRFAKFPKNSFPAARLNTQEKQYLQLAAQGFTKEQIIKEMNILNMNFCNYIIYEICNKLNAKNITNSVYIAMHNKII